MEIVKRHAQYSNYPISDDVALFLAQEFSTNIRELEGAYNKASARASIEGVELTVELTKEYLNFSEHLSISGKVRYNTKTTQD